MVTRKSKFSGHQTFTVRYGWIEKGYRFIKSGFSFNQEDAIVHLGVGKNMVDSIRYWVELSGLLEYQEASRLADKLLDEENGWDPYLEDNNSYWLLHWNINTNSDLFHSGTAIFSYLRKPEFSKKDVNDSVLHIVEATDKRKPSVNILSKDIDCFLKLYVGNRRYIQGQKDEGFDSPFQELNLIQLMNDSDLYCFNIGYKPNLSAEIICYALWSYMKRHRKATVTVNEALYGEESPGQIFMLDENSLIGAIESLSNQEKWSDCIGYNEAAGIALLYCELEDGMSLLESYYTEGGLE
ncbi:MAG: DUF4007 family protein [Bacteroidia bacterium]|nr:DUF4007 family protein [Bacteroidia bacterium]